MKKKTARFLANLLLKCGNSPSRLKPPPRAEADFAPFGLAILRLRMFLGKPAQPLHDWV